MWKVIVGLALVLAVPGAQACQVVPLVDLDFPDKPVCRASDDCDALPAHGASTTYEGMLHWSWDIDQCTVENGLPGGEVTVRIGPTGTTPDWMRVRADPEEVVITAQEQVDPRNMHVEGVGGNTRVYFQVDKPVEVTFTRLGAADAEGLERIDARDGVLPMFLKAHGESATAQLDAFGVEEFRFDAAYLLDSHPAGRPLDSEESTPWPLPVTGLALLGAVLLARRR